MKTYLFTQPYCIDEAIDIPSSLYVELTPELIQNIDRVQNHLSTLKEEGITVYGLDMLWLDVQASSLFIQMDDRTLGHPNPDVKLSITPLSSGQNAVFEGIVPEEPEADTKDDKEIEDETPQIGSCGLRISDGGIKLIAWIDTNNYFISSSLIDWKEVTETINTNQR